MAEQTESPTGPDLTAGVPSADLAEGALLTGRVGEDAVLLTRVKGQCYAVGATCTHYGGPLGEGLLIGHEIRCPWHHAAFDVRTGAMRRPPGLNDLPCWRVTEENGRVRVTERATAPSRKPPRRRNGVPDDILIIGAGAAGTVAVQTLRAEGYTGRLTIIDGDPDEPVDRPNLSKDYLAGSAPEEWIPLRPPDFFRDLGVERLVGRRAAALDALAKRVTLDDGSTRTFDAMLLATGASPIQLPIPTSPRLPLMTLRTLADSRAIIAAAERAGSGAPAVVIGASFIGLEVAASLRARGLEVHVVAPEDRPLGRVLGPALGDVVRAVHEEHGVIFHLGQKPRETRDDGVVLESGEVLPARLAVAGVGVRPNLALAEGAGLDLDRGVMVSERLETSVPGIFAAGDIARWPDVRTGERLRVEHWVVAERQAQTAARNLLGAGERFEAIPFFWSAHYDLIIDYIGHAEKWDRIEIEGRPERRDCAARYIGRGMVLAVATIGRDRVNLEAELRMEREIAPAVSGRV